jgi:hypothetical protein
VEKLALRDPELGTQLFLTRLAAMAWARAFCEPSRGVQCVLLDISTKPHAVDWDELEQYTQDAGAYSHYIGLILFYHANINRFGAEFYDSAEELWSDWEELLLKGD